MAAELEDVVSCEICKIGFPSLTILMQHMVIHTEEKSCPCLICSLFLQSSHLNRHMTVESEPGKVALQNNQNQNKNMYWQFCQMINNEIKHFDESNSKFICKQKEKNQMLEHVADSDIDSEQEKITVTKESGYVDEMSNSFSEDLMPFTDGNVNVSDVSKDSAISYLTCHGQHEAKQTTAANTDFNGHEKQPQLKANVKTVPKMVKKRPVITVVFNSSRSNLSNTGISFTCSICGCKQFTNYSDFKEHMSAHSGKTSSSIKHNIRTHSGKDVNTYIESGTYEGTENKMETNDIEDQTDEHFEPKSPTDSDSDNISEQNDLDSDVDIDTPNPLSTNNDDADLMSKSNYDSETEELESLIAIHAEKLAKKCDLCGKKIVNLRRHMENHLYKKPHKCHLCPKRYSQKFYLKRHIEMHTNENRTCPVCNIEFSKLHNLQKHLTLHTANGYYEVVDKEKYNNDSSESKQHICHVCGKTFWKAFALNMHSVIHTGDKPHICHICGKGFSQLGNMKDHIEIHAGVKSHVCQICDKAFTSKKALVKHSILHDRKLKFKCHVCSKSFLRTKCLKKHMLTHTGDARYPCDTSDKDSMEQSHLTRHNKTHIKTLTVEEMPLGTNVTYYYTSI